MWNETDRRVRGVCVPAGHVLISASMSVNMLVYAGNVKRFRVKDVYEKTLSSSLTMAFAWILGI